MKKEKKTLLEEEKFVPFKGWTITEICVWYVYACAITFGLVTVFKGGHFLAGGLIICGANFFYDNLTIARKKKKEEKPKKKRNISG